MSYIDEIFERANLQNIREFLLHGVGEEAQTEKSYKERINEAQKSIEYIHNKFPEKKECDEIMEIIFDNISAAQEVYLEIGMKCGAKLITELLETF